MILFENQNRSDEVIDIDISRFVNCRFTRCELRYSGMGQPEFVDCIFEDCTWSFDGIAKRTIEYIRSLVAALGSDADDAIDAVLGREPALAR